MHDHRLRARQQPRSEPGLQLDALEKAGCEQVFEDHVSGASAERPGWAKATTALHEGDTLVVWRLDHLGRSLKHLTTPSTSSTDAALGSRASPRTSTPPR